MTTTIFDVMKNGKNVENTIKYDIISALCKKGDFFYGKRNNFY